ncbi:probable serine carboxypeptidase CPVL [Ixodes scapularis]|uniref:probable serine carboxypeptidase CPVL n=1 Tax=Ixodes scapularis TaxID=6945 RepID=UPI001C38E54E|nr:probable serine carboxypeptidase CPVL [Ixodes scapularis]
MAIPIPYWPTEMMWQRDTQGQTMRLRLLACVWVALLCSYAVRQADSKPLQPVPVDERDAEGDANGSETKEPDDTGPLFITKVVKEEGTEVAKKLSKVILPRDFPVFEAYSGYITVDETYDSNMFFFLVKAKPDDPNKPLTIWMEGGPGFSGLLGMFTKNGPVGITKDGVICARLDALTENTDVVYLDAPVGGGFSFTKNMTHGFSKDLTGTSKDISEFLKQFLNVFSEYKTRDLYVGGESYGGRLAVGFANYISENENRPSSDVATRFNLKGVVAGSPFLGPLLETIDSSEFLFSVGMLNTTSKVLFHQAFENLTKETDRRKQLFTFLQTVFQDYTKKNPTLFQRLTGYNIHSSVLHTRIPQVFVEYKKYVNNSDFKTRIHVGSDAVLRKQTLNVIFSMGMVDFFTNINSIVESVFNKFKVLIYGGQLDTIFPAINMDKFYNSLTWEGSEDFKKKRVTWYSENDPDYLNGYVRKGGNVAYVLLVGAGHDPGFDAPKPTHTLIGKFLKQQEILKSVNTADALLKED